MRPSRSATRSFTGRLGFSYGSCAALALCLVVAPAPGVARPATSANTSAATLMARNPFARITRLLPFVATAYADALPRAVLDTHEVARSTVKPPTWGDRAAPLNRTGVLIAR